MKTRKVILFFVLALCLSNVRSFGQCPFPPAPPTVDPKAVPQPIVIDARDGKFEGPRQFRVDDSTQLILKNKNPFRYSYVVTVDETVVVEDAIGKFLNFAKIGTAAPASNPPAAQNQAPPAPVAPCPAQTAAQLARNDADLKAAIANLKKAVGDTIDEYETLTAAVKGKLLDPLAEGSTLCQNAQDAVRRIGTFRPTTSPTPAEELARLRPLIENQEQALEDAQDNCRKPDYDATIEDAKDLIDWAKKQIEELHGRQKDLEDLSTEVTNTLQRADAFWEARPLGPYADRMEVKISVKGTDKTVEGATAKVIRPEVLVRFGAGKRFFMAGGIAASSADRSTYKVIDGFAYDRNGTAMTDTDGKPIFGKVVGKEEDSVGRVSPAILLHGILGHPIPGMGLGLSLGVCASGSDASVLEFFAGPTLSFADDNLFLTFGAFRGNEKKLAGDLYVGAPMPTSATLSTIDRNTWNFGVGLSYRIP